MAGLARAVAPGLSHHVTRGVGAAECDALRHHEHTARPLGDGRFIERLETTLARSLKKKKPGPKRTRGDSG
jgi:hypothetical protein